MEASEAERSVLPLLLPPPDHRRRRGGGGQMKRRTMNDDDDAFWIVSLCDLHRFLCLRERVYVRLCVCFRSAFARGSVRLLSLSPSLLVLPSSSSPFAFASQNAALRREKEREGRRERRFLQTICFCVEREKNAGKREEREREKGKKGNTSHMHHERASSLVISVSLAVSRFPFRGCHSSLAFSCSYCCYCAPLLLPLK